MTLEHFNEELDRMTAHAKDTLAKVEQRIESMLKDHPERMAEYRAGCARMNAWMKANPEAIRLPDLDFFSKPLTESE